MTRAKRLWTDGMPMYCMRTCIEIGKIESSTSIHTCGLIWFMKGFCLDTASMHSCSVPTHGQRTLSPRKTLRHLRCQSAHFEYISAPSGSKRSNSTSAPSGSIHRGACQGQYWRNSAYIATKKRFSADATSPPLALSIIWNRYISITSPM